MKNRDVNPTLQSDAIRNSDWSNDQNYFLYQNAPIDLLSELNEYSGLKNNLDVLAVYDKYIKETKSVLEIGAGTGRILNALATLNYNGHISCIERQKKYVDLLSHHYAKTVTIYSQDIRLFKAKRCYEVMLWMWLGFSEFAQIEQKQILAKITYFLQKSGKIIIDFVNLSTFRRDRNFLIKNHCGISSYKYLPTFEEIETYAKEANLSIIDVIDYTVNKNGHTKTLVVFQKTSIRKNKNARS